MRQEDDALGTPLSGQSAQAIGIMGLLGDQTFDRPDGSNQRWRYGDSPGVNHLFTTCRSYLL
jgi:hypothetical protein